MQPVLLYPRRSRFAPIYFADYWKEHYLCLNLSKYRPFVKTNTENLRGYRKSKFTCFFLFGYSAIRNECPFQKCDTPVSFNEDDRR